MDPLSVGASVVGLLAAGAKVTTQLFGLVTKVQEAPALAKNVLWEIADISAALGHIQEYVLGRQAVAPQRGSLILLEHVLASLTGCVTTYSDLQALLDRLNIDPDMGVFDRIKWVREESSLNTIIQRLQRHKASLVLILTTIQCDSMQEAELSTSRLCELVEEMLHSNKDLAARIHRLERQGSTISRAGSVLLLPDNEALTQNSTSARVSACLTSAMQAIKFTFERDLEESRVYNRVQDAQRLSLTSTTSTALHSTALSIFSKLSLSEVSVISFYALPIYATDLANSDCYLFGDSAIFENPFLVKSAQTSSPSLQGSSAAVPRTLFDTAQGKDQKAFGVVMYDFEAQRADELGAKAGEAIIVIAISNAEWVVAKPISRLGGPGLIPLCFIEIRDMKTNRALGDPLDVLRAMGVMSVQEYKESSRKYISGSISVSGPSKKV